MKTPHHLIIAAAFIAAVVTTPAQDASESAALCRLALQKLDTEAPKLPADVRAEKEMLRNVIRRFYLEPEDISLSENEIAKMILGRLGMIDERYEDITGLFTEPKKSAPVKKTKVVKEPGPVKKVAAPKRPSRAIQAKIPILTGVPTFRGYSASPPGGELGIVEMRFQGRTSTIIEIPVKASERSLDARAKKVASRLTLLNKRDRFWSYKMSAGERNREVVIRCPKSPGGFIITADSDFAGKMGQDKNALCNDIMRRIRRNVDNRLANGNARPADGESPRTQAISLRQKGDRAYEKDADQAVEFYSQAITADETYALSYLRLAAVYIAQGDKETARSTLLNARDKVSEGDRKLLEQALAKLGV